MKTMEASNGTYDIERLHGEIRDKYHVVHKDYTLLLKEDENSEGIPVVFEKEEDVAKFFQITDAPKELSASAEVILYPISFYNNGAFLVTNLHYKGDGISDVNE